MPVGKKLGVVLSVVVAGASVALFFRKDASPFKFWQTGSTDPFEEHVERRVTTDAAWSRQGSPARSGSADAQALRVPATTAAIKQPPGLAGDNQPTFQKNLSPVGALLPPIEGIVGVDDESDTADDLNSAAFAPSGGVSRHVVVDGDTLSKLAVRYLGRGDAYRDIFDLNRDVLTSPELLPIGAVLKIPPPRGPEVAAGPLDGAPGGGESEEGSPSQLVPVLGNPGRGTP